VAKKLAERISKRNYSEEEIKTRIKSIEEKYPGSQITRIRSVFAKGMNKIVDAINWEAGLSETLQYQGSVSFVHINNMVEPEPKKLSETKGLVIADYQNYLESELIIKLRNDYKIEINKDLLPKIEL